MTPVLARLQAWWLDFVLALAFLTRLPAPFGTPPTDRALGPALRTAPLAGIVVGLIGAAVFWLAGAVGLPPALAALLAVGATIGATGALHEDGLADVADGFGGAFARARKLAIMRDSRTGAFGVLALILSVGLRAGALAVIAAPVPALAALVAAHALSRAALPGIMAGLSPARADGLASDAGRPSGQDALAAAVLGLVVAILAAGFRDGLVAVAVAGLAAVLMAALARHQIGGYTGDVLGAAQQVGEAAVLLAAAALAAQLS
jgi:adenosylcobinamide-GDP ribazoletransferase